MISRILIILAVSLSGCYTLDEGRNVELSGQEIQKLYKLDTMEVVILNQTNDKYIIVDATKEVITPIYSFQEKTSGVFILMLGCVAFGILMGVVSQE